MNKVYLIEEGYPHVSLTEKGIITNEKTNRIITVRRDGCFDLQYNKIKKCFSLNRLLSKYFIEPNMDLTPVPGYEGRYSATKDGQVYSHRHYKFLTPAVHKSGYLHLRLGEEPFYLHRIIALTFIPNPNNLSEINHKDENKLNCHVDNLEWCDRKYNVNYGTRNKRVSETNKIVMKEWWDKRKSED